MAGHDAPIVRDVEPGAGRQLGAQRLGLAPLRGLARGRRVGHLVERFLLVGRLILSPPSSCASTLDDIMRAR
ncbi:MAG: hypothetical protein MZW92_70925 [Comamonadaceae bacterium]|nr:hypothetical protein [Comamonadaceae bacterium]